jgi:hypothetical protein
MSRNSMPKPSLASNLETGPPWMLQLKRECAPPLTLSIWWSSMTMSSYELTSRPISNWVKAGDAKVIRAESMERGFMYRFC